MTRVHHSLRLVVQGIKNVPWSDQCTSKLRLQKSMPILETGMSAITLELHKNINDANITVTLERLASTYKYILYLKYYDITVCETSNRPSWNKGLSGQATTLTDTIKFNHISLIAFALDPVTAVYSLPKFQYSKSIFVLFLCWRMTYYIIFNKIEASSSITRILN